MFHTGEGRKVVFMNYRDIAFILETGQIPNDFNDDIIKKLTEEIDKINDKYLSFEAIFSYIENMIGRKLTNIELLKIFINLYNHVIDFYKNDIVDNLYCILSDADYDKVCNYMRETNEDLYPKFFTYTETALCRKLTENEILDILAGICYDFCHYTSDEHEFINDLGLDKILYDYNIK